MINKACKLIIFLLLFMSSFIMAAKAGNYPEELGKVEWIRDYSKALKQAESSGKALLVLFQEVPGCITCRTYGKEVLSNPLVKEAIESLFVPVAVYNNKGGDDRKVLDKYGEPAWNNPVLRIVSPGEKALYRRISGDYSLSGLLKGMVAALEKQGRPVPEYLKLLLEEEILKTAKKEEDIFTMFCFWRGEAVFGDVEGVYKTEPGFVSGGEAVLVEYSPGIISSKELRKLASSSSCRSVKLKERSSYRKAADPQYYLSKSLYRYVPMTRLQVLRLNKALGEASDPVRYLSPNQLMIFDKIKEEPGAAWKDARYNELVPSWNSAMKLIRRN